MYSLRCSYFRQELPGREHSNPEPIDQTKVLDVERYDRIALGRDGDLGNHVVLRIGQQRPPKKEYALLACHTTDVVEQVAHILRVEVQARSLPGQYILVFDDEWH